jgi:hypothetical protein
MSDDRTLQYRIYLIKLLHHIAFNSEKETVACYRSLVLKLARGRVSAEETYRRFATCISVHSVVQALEWNCKQVFSAIATNLMLAEA